MEQFRNAYRVLMGKPQSRRPLGRPRHGWEDNIKMYLREVGCDPGDWMALAEDRDQWRAYVRAVMTSGFLESQLVSYNIIISYNIYILNSCPTQGRVEEWDAMKPPYYRSVSSKGAGRPRLMHHHKGGWNETKWMRWVWRNGGMKFVVGENGRNPVKNLPRPHVVHHETHMEGLRSELGTPAVGGEQLTACATRPPILSIAIL